MNEMKRLIARLLAATFLVGGLLILPAAPAAAHDDNPLTAVRKATAKFHNVKTAEAAGYGRLLDCFDLPGVGGMGQHYVKGPLSATVIPTEPSAMVYEVDGSELRLVAVEYIIPQSNWTASQPPRLFGQWFLRNDTLGLWTLHAWIWRNNPLGTFASYNPEVSMCPGHAPLDD
jgi:hypothetical protein